MRGRDISGAAMITRSKWKGAVRKDDNVVVTFVVTQPTRPDDSKSSYVELDDGARLSQLGDQ